MRKDVHRHTFGYALRLYLDCEKPIREDDKDNTDYETFAEITLRVNKRFPNAGHELNITQRRTNQEYDEPEEKEEYLEIDLDKFEVFQAFVNKLGEEIETLKKEFAEINIEDYPEDTLITIHDDEAKRIFKCNVCGAMLYPLCDTWKLQQNQLDHGIFIYYCVKCERMIAEHTKEI